MAVMLACMSAVYAQESTGAGQMQLAAGQKVKVSGVIVGRSGDSFVLRDDRGMDVTVKLSGATVIKEKKSNPFRGALHYDSNDLVRGLNLEVEGLGDADGALAARDVRFTQTQLMMAESVESRVTPVEGRLAETETRLSGAEENAKHLSGQIDEVKALTEAARGSAKAAQTTADQAVEGVSAANERISSVDESLNTRISAVDDFQLQKSVTVHFKFGSAVLSDDAKAQLENLAAEAKNQKGYVVEVAGFASQDGDAAYNRALSQRRADAVVQYLADSMVPLRRIVTPFGFGEKLPVADNTTLAGREENRRVEVKILVSKGLAATENSGGMASGKQR